MLPEVALGADKVDRGSQENDEPAAAAAQQQGLGSQDDDEGTEGCEDDEAEELEEEEQQQQEGEEEELQGEVWHEEGPVHGHSCGNGAAGSTPSLRQPLGPVSQQQQDAGAPAEALKGGWPAHSALATPGQKGGSENAGV
jgi:hypothetical protein